MLSYDVQSVSPEKKTFHRVPVSLVMERGQLVPPEYQSFNNPTSLQLRFFSKFLIYFLMWKLETGQWPQAFERPLSAMVMFLVNTK